MAELKINIPKFADGDWMPIEHTGRGKDISPDIRLSGIDDKAVSIAVTMDDADHPLFPNYNHWVIWNLPVSEIIPEGIPKGSTVESFGGAKQGITYGRHRYKGPKPPFKAIHIYVFTVYTLDTTIKISSKSTKRDFLAAAQGHILQKAVYTGKFQSCQK